MITVYILASGATIPVEIEFPDSLTSLQDTSQEETRKSEEPEEPDEAEDQGGGEEVMDTEEPGIEEYEEDEEDEEVDEVDPPEPEGEEAQEEGLSAGWIVIGVVLGLAVIGGIIYTVQKRRR